MNNPDKDGWTEHTPGPCPCPNVFVSVKFRDERQFFGPAEKLLWGECGSGTITHYRIWEPVKPPASKPEPEAPTLRDQFAMAALTGLCASLNGTDNWEVLGKEAAIYAYEFADAMLEVRKGGAE